MTLKPKSPLGALLDNIQLPLMDFRMLWTDTFYLHKFNFIVKSLNI